MDRPTYFRTRSLAALVGGAALFCYSAAALAAEPTISLSPEGITIESASFGEITLSYPHLLTGSNSEHGLSGATVNGTTADVSYAGGAQVHVEVLQGQILFTFNDMPQDVNATRINSTLGFSGLVGGTWAIGKKTGDFPAEKPENPFLYKGDAGNFQITAPGGGTLRLKLPGVGWQQLQDNREWQTKAFAWQYKYFYDNAKPQYTILVDEGSSEPKEATAAPVKEAKPLADGPTPYPPAKSKAWPGKGVIRGPGFGWVAGERAAFWKNRAKDQGAIVFAGDSLTGGWKDLAKSFPNLKVANRGVGGDVSRGLLFRFKEDVLSLNPKAVVIEIGNNDLTALDKSGSAASNIAEMIDLVAAYNPAVPVIVCTVPPSDKPDAPIDPAVRDALNEAIRKLPESKSNVYLCDLSVAVSNPDGTLNPTYFAKDKIHFGGAGRKKWAETIYPIFEKLKLTSAN